MFISKKRYNEIMENRESALDIAKTTLEANGRLLKQQDANLKLCQEVNDHNKRLIDKLEELEKKLKEAEAKIAKKIFTDLFSKVGFDGHNVSIFENELVEVAKKYIVEIDYDSQENME